MPPPLLFKDVIQSGEAAFDAPAESAEYRKAAAVRIVPGSEAIRRDGRVLLFIDPGQPDSVTLDLTASHKAYRESRNKHVVAPDEGQVIGRFRQLAAQGVALREDSSTRLSSGSPVTQTQEVPSMMHNNRPGTPAPVIGKPFVPTSSTPINGMAHPQVRKPDFQPSPGVTAAAPDKVAYWDIPGFDEIPVAYHDIIFDGDNLILIYDERYRGSKPYMPKTSTNALAFCPVGGNEVFIVVPSGAVFPLDGRLCCVLRVAEIVTIDQYKAAQAAPPVSSPFRSHASEYASDHASVPIQPGPVSYDGPVIEFPPDGATGAIGAIGAASPAGSPGAVLPPKAVMSFSQLQKSLGYPSFAEQSINLGFGQTTPTAPTRTVQKSQAEVGEAMDSILDQALRSISR